MLTKCGGRCRGNWETLANRFEIEDSGENLVDFGCHQSYYWCIGTEDRSYPMFTLEAFQSSAVAKLHNALVKAKRALLQSATGSGKTVIAGQFVMEHLAADPRNNVLCLVQLQALVNQFYTTFSKGFGIDVSVLHETITRSKEGERLAYNPNGRFQLTMPETFYNTVGLIDKNKLTWNANWEPTLILIDEAHKATSLYYQMIRDMFPDALILGMTATPFREKNKDGECLVEWYGDNLITTISVRELIDLKRLVAPKHFEIKGGNVVKTWLEMTEGEDNKATIVFAKNTRHAAALLKAFLKAGATAEQITSVDDEEAGTKFQTANERNRIYRAFDNGDIDVLVSVSALCEGFDATRARYCFIDRTVGNHALYHQMIGRVIRAHEGKLDAIVVDFVGNKHPAIEDYQWSIEAAKPSVKHLGEERSMSDDAFQKATNVFVNCLTEDCHRVFDAKAHAHCPDCKGKVTIARTVQMLADVVTARLSMGREEWDQFLARVSGAEGNSLRMELVNKKHGVIFVDGKFREDLTWIPAAAEAMKKNKAAWSSKFLMAA